MKLEVKVPSVGESVTQSTIDTWEKSEGDLVQKGDILVLLETDKASMEIPAQDTGVLHIIKSNGETVLVGDVIATIDTSQKPSLSNDSSRSKPPQVTTLKNKNQNPILPNENKNKSLKDGNQNSTFPFKLSPSTRQLIG